MRPVRPASRHGTGRDRRKLKRRSSRTDIRQPGGSGSARRPDGSSRSPHDPTAFHGSAPLCRICHGSPGFARSTGRTDCGDLSRIVCIAASRIGSRAAAIWAAVQGSCPATRSAAGGQSVVMRRDGHARRGCREARRQRHGAGAAVHHVPSAAGVDEVIPRAPDDDVGAVAHMDRVGAVAAADPVAADAADDAVGGRAAFDSVVALPAAQGVVTRAARYRVVDRLARKPVLAPAALQDIGAVVPLDCVFAGRPLQEVAAEPAVDDVGTPPGNSGRQDRRRRPSRPRCAAGCRC